MGSFALNRPKAAPTVSQNLVIVPYAKEKPDAPIASGAIATAGSGTGAVDVLMMADADPNASLSDLQPLFRMEGAITISLDGKIVFNGTVKAIGGADSLGASYIASVPFVLSHPQLAGDWMTSAGNAAP